MHHWKQTCEIAWITSEDREPESFRQGGRLWHLSHRRTPPASPGETNALGDKKLDCQYHSLT